MKHLYLLYTLLVGCYAIPIIPEATGSKDPPNLFGVDLSVAASYSQFKCLQQNGYNAAFIRAYSPAGNGLFDPNACSNINNAHNAGLGTEVYMTPQPTSLKKGYQQFDDVFNGLKANGISLNSLWIQVTSPRNWPGTTKQNIDFISSILSRGQQYGIYLGIYTNYYDWSQITGGWPAGSNIMLWYWNIYGPGVGGESPANFGDFRPFGSWTVPTVKQFAQAESLCSISFNRDVYAAAVTPPKVFKSENATSIEKSDVAIIEKSSVLTVGHIGLL